VSPMRPPRACAVPGCPGLIRGAQGCPYHPRRPWAHKSGPRAARGYDSIWDRIRLLALARDGYACQVPGCAAPTRAVDHRVPLHLGGLSTIDNAFSLCVTHHRQKTAREGNRARRNRR
jgi:5-methylcytosine-specific restriction protein A